VEERITVIKASGDRRISKKNYTEGYEDSDNGGKLFVKLVICLVMTCQFQRCHQDVVSTM